MPKYTYFKRYRMELDLHRPPAADRGGALPPGFFWVPWHDGLLAHHAEVKAACFADQMDAAIFPCLGSPAGCHALMCAIRGRAGFCPAATWLVASADPLPPDIAPAGGCVATIQGLLDENGYGGIQNVGVVPEFRGRGIGRALVLQALAGFAARGARRAYLEVTARNDPAVRMYRDLGFRCHRTLYRAVDVPEPAGTTV